LAAVGVAAGAVGYASAHGGQAVAVDGVGTLAKIVVAAVVGHAEQQELVVDGVGFFSPSTANFLLFDVNIYWICSPKDLKPSVFNVNNERSITRQHLPKIITFNILGRLVEKDPTKRLLNHFYNL
jgi:hypothetical protein